MTDAQIAAMRAVLDTTLEQTIQSYHGFMESTVHTKAEDLLNNDFRNNLIQQLAAAADSAAPTQEPT